MMNSLSRSASLEVALFQGSANQILGLDIYWVNDQRR
jgi:hypothetical protein